MSTHRLGDENSLPILGIATCTHDVFEQNGDHHPHQQHQKTHTGKTPQHTTKKYIGPNQSTPYSILLQVLWTLLFHEKQQLFRPLQPAHSPLLYLRYNAPGTPLFGVGIPFDRLL